MVLVYWIGIKNKLMDNFLIKKFIKNNDNTRDPKVREDYGKMTGIVGIITNLIICIAKLVTGAIFKSISIAADGINNLSDVSTSLMTLIGFKLSGKDPDKKHPYGHGRTEYLLGLGVSIVILLIGLSLFRESFEKTIHPETVVFSWLSVGILTFSIVLKIWQSSFYKRIGVLIDSKALKAAAYDSRNDVLATSAVLISTIAAGFTSFNLDGPMGLIVSLLIIKSGIGLIKEMTAPIIGEAPDPDVVNEISGIIAQHKGILGHHDLLIHDYGPGRLYASIDVEVDGYRNIFDIHDEIDSIENEILEKTGIEMSIHMDPIAVGDPNLERAKKIINEVVIRTEGVIDAHDIRVKEEDDKKAVIFDLVRIDSCSYDDEALTKIFDNELKKEDIKYEARPIFEKGFE